MVIVAGGTGVLGSNLAVELDRRGARLVIAGRDRDRAAAVASTLGDAIPARLDFADDTSVTATVDAAISRFGRLDGLVNAAGVVAFGPLDGMTRHQLTEVIETDLIGPLDLMRVALPHLDGGFVVLLTGVVAEQPVGNMAVYSAAKAGLSSASTALNRELRRRRITVLDARPPHTETGLADRPISGRAPKLPQGLDPQRVAELVVQGIENGTRDLPSSEFTI